MPSLLPFQALRYAGPDAMAFIPGEDATPCFDPNLLTEDPAPALFLYEQRFDGLSRRGVIGLLNRAEATVLPHEEFLAESVEGCRNEEVQSSSIFLWCRDDGAALAPLLDSETPPLIDTTDRANCRHLIWRIDAPTKIAAIQSALAGQELFIADGHHRYAAGWTLATIQVRTAALQTRAAHRLVAEEIPLPGLQPIEDLEAYLAAPERGHVRFGILTPAGELKGIELPHNKSERNVSVLKRLILHDRPFQTTRGLDSTRAAVAAGRARMAFLLNPIPLDKIEADARRGALLPPKSTDFFPKLAGGLIMHRNQLLRGQNEKTSPPVAQRRGV